MLTITEALEAYKNGRPVQVEVSPEIWKDIEEEYLGSPGRYRIRPPKPYKSAEEFLDAQKKHGPYVKVKCKEDSQNYYYASIIRVYPRFVDLGIFRGHSTNNVCKITYEEFLDTRYFTWQDGTICGVE